MIRKYKLNKKLPVSAIMKLVDDIDWEWGQDLLSYKGNNNSKLINYFLDQCPKFKTKRAVVGIHYTNGEIPEHRDLLSKSVFVFPIKYGKNTEFHVENTSVKFKKGYCYRFNDWLYHSVSNDNHANLVLVTVSFEEP